MSESSAAQDITEFQNKFLFFKLAESLYCVRLSYVDRVIYMTETQKVPAMPAYFIGLLNLHNEKVPVLDLANKLQIREDSRYTIDTPIILCLHDKQHLGFIVDETIDVDDIHASDIKAQNLFQNEVAAYIEGSAHSERGDALVFNPIKIFEENLFQGD